MKPAPRALPQLTGEPNVVPMIDVLLVLLIIFMIAQSAGRRAFDLQLPQDTGSTSSAPSIVLSVEPGPRYVLNGSAINPAALTLQLRQVYDGRPTKVLFVRGAPTVRYQDVITAYDAARGAGVKVTGVAPYTSNPR